LRQRRREQRRRRDHERAVRGPEGQRVRGRARKGRARGLPAVQAPAHPLRHGSHLMKYSPETPRDSAKYAVGRAAVDRYAHDGARLGLGSGTTSAWMVRALGEKVAEGLQVIGVPTSTSTRDLALSLDIPLVDINDLDRPLDVTLDGPDEIDHDGDM